MKIESSIKRINELMSRFVAQIKGEASIGRTDLNKAAETVLVPLLNEMYGWNLKNINYAEGSNNYPGIDLADEAVGISIQVTATSTAEKVKHTIEQFTKHYQYLKYNRLIIYILKEKQDSYPERTIQKIIQNRFEFHPRKDIWDWRDLLKEISNSQIDRTLRVQEILEANFGNDKQQLPDREVSDKVARIIEEHKFFIQRPEQEKLDKFLCERSNGLLLVTAGAGFGKSALLASWIEILQNKNYFVAYHFFHQRDNTTSNLSRAYRNLLQQLHLYYGFGHKHIANLEEERRNELYHLLSNKAAQPDQPLVVLIDGLDEAERTFQPPFPVPLPKNVFVIVSAREGKNPEYLRGWTDTAEVILLDRLSREAIITWLKQSNEGQIAELAEDHDFVSQLDEITQGYPLYLRYLIDELNHAAKQRQDARLILKETPKGFEQYVKAQRDNLDKLGLPDERWQFFALMATAKGALEKTDVKAITGMKDRSFRELEQCWQVTRWLKISDDGLYAFAHPRLGEAFAAHLEEDTENAVKSLIDYCGQWQNHHSPYALRHYADHLEQDRQWSELFALARNSEFVEAQRCVFVNQPSLLLKTIQIALQMALEINDPPAIVEFLLRHAHELAKITDRETPLQVLSSNVSRALKLIELYSVDLYIIWALLIVWELKEIEKENAQILLKKLQSRLSSIDVPNFLDNKRIKNWQGNLVALALAYIFEIDVAGCTILSQRLLGDPGSRYWAIFEHALFERGLFSEAIKLRKQQNHLFSLIEIAELQTQEVGLEAAKLTYCEIIALLGSWNSSPDNIFPVAISAKKQLEMGYRDLAKYIFVRLIAAADELQDFNNQIKALLSIAYCQIESGELDRLFLQDASATLQKINSSDITHPSMKSKFLEEMAKLSVKSGDDAQARSYLNQALEIAQSITEEEIKQVALKDLVDTQASVGFTEDAIETARMIVKNTYRTQAFSYILSSQLKENSFEAALKTVEQDYWNKPLGLHRIAQAQAEAQQFEDAIKTAEQVPEGSDRDSAWASIVKAQARVLLRTGYSKETIGEILQTIEQKIIGDQEQIQTLMAIAEIQLEQGDFTAAIPTLEKIERLANQSTVKKLLAIAYARNGNFDEASVIAKKIEDSQTYVEALETIARIQRRTGRINDARSTYAEMLSASTKPDIFSLKAVTLMSIANAQVEGVQRQIVPTILQWASENIEAVSDLFIKSQLLAFLAEKWAEAGEMKISEQKFQDSMEFAKRVVEKSKNVLGSSQIFATIAMYKARIGDYNAALKIIEHVPFLLLKAEVYLAIANAQKQIGAIASQQKLQKLFADSYEEFQNSSTFRLNNPVRLLSKIAIAQAVIGNATEAKENLIQVYNSYVRDETNRKVKIEGLVSIVIAFTQIPDIDAAVALLAEIEVPKKRIEALWAIACAQFKQNQIVAVKKSLQLATQAYEEILDESQRVESIGILARIQALAGDHRQAICSVESALDQSVTLLPELINIFINLEEVEYVKQLIIPCSYYLEPAYEVCQSLARLYPEYTLEISDIVRNSYL